MLKCTHRDVCGCVCIPESGARGRESFLPPLSDDGEGESWYSWYWELLDCESESVYAGGS